MQFYDLGMKIMQSFEAVMYSYLKKELPVFLINKPFVI
jgi:hypothetical protein